MSDEIDELWCRIKAIEEKVDDLMKYCDELAYFVRIVSVDNKIYRSEKEGEQS